MAVTQAQITIPANGSPTTVLSATAANANQISIRNTGSTTVLLGPPGHTPLFPLVANEFFGLQVGPDDQLIAQVATPGTAGTLVVLGAG